MNQKYQNLGPWPVKDTVGFHVALAQLSYAQSKGRNKTEHLQFDTVRKLRTSASHVHEVSAGTNFSTTHTFRDLQGRAFTNSSCPTQSRAFKKIIEGLLHHMGKQTKSNMGLDYKILRLILEKYEKELIDPNSSVERKRWITMCGNFFVLGFVLSLRGNEGFKIEAQGLRSHLQLGTELEEPTPYILIPSLGRFKGEEGEKWHLMMSASHTKSGFEVRKWVHRLVQILEHEGQTSFL